MLGKWRKGLALIGIWLWACAPSRGADRLPTPNEQVRATLVDKCLTCHAGETPKGGLDLTRRASALAGGEGGAAVVPGKPDESLLFEKVASGEMPPKNPLSAEAVAAFKSWIEGGAGYPEEPLAVRRAGRDWWSLQPIKRPKAPGVESSWVRNPIDAFIFQKLHANGLKPAPEADRPALIRRLSFDLNGLPPTPEEVDAFVGDRGSNAYERLVDRLLASPGYGERWGRHWLDVVRFGESHGYEMNQPRPNAWPYRDYVIRAFNLDTPLPRFMLEQLAADTLNDVDGLTRAATGFLVGGAHDEVGNATPEGMLQQRADDLDDMITATGSAFLGLTINCARCHDHKFDPITQRDYYGLQAVFSGVTHANRVISADETPERKAAATRVAAELAKVENEIDAGEPLARVDRDTPARAGVRFDRNVERFPAIVAQGVRFTVLSTSNGSESGIDELEVWTNGDAPRNVALASTGGKASASSEYPNAAIHKISHLNDGQAGNDHSWISKSPGRGWARVDWTKPVAIDRVVWGRDREGKFSDRLAVEYYVEADLGGGRWQVVASSIDRAKGPQGGGTAGQAELRARQLALREKLASLGSQRSVYAGSFAEPGPTHVLRRGDPTQKGDVVGPSAPSAVSPALVLSSGAAEAERRAGFARWLGDVGNPLPSRVMVNRVWHYHFGQGIVASPSDFGFNGATPSHPELLDWLASEYAANGYRLKPIHRMIVLSSTYRQASRAEAGAKGPAVDKGNRWLWRYPPRRLETEPLRDAILAVSGKLDPAMGGPGYSPWEPNSNYVRVYNPKAELGPAEFRRMVYQFKPRSRQDPTFGAFDCPDAALVAPRRTVSTTAIQALSLLNSRFIIQQADFLAERLTREAGGNPAAQADRAFRLAFGRPASDLEKNVSADLIRNNGLPAFCRTIYNTNEFVYLP